MRKFLKKIFCKSQERLEYSTIETWTNSSDYWEKRYLLGGNSGAGSYGKLAEFKAEIINKFIKDNGVNSVIEWGCGDGNQLLLAQYPQYIGFDVSKKAISLCKEKFKDDKTKCFIYSGDKHFSNNKTADIALSLDVIYHLIEDDVFNLYMERLFNSASKYVCIYSCDDDIIIDAPHVKHRHFSSWIKKHREDWTLMDYIPNIYPYDINNNETTWSDFYFYKKK